MQPGLRTIAPARRVLSPLNSIAVFFFFFSLSPVCCFAHAVYLSSPTRAPAVRALSPNHWTTRELLQFLSNGAQQNFNNVFYVIYPCILFLQLCHKLFEDRYCASFFRFSTGFSSIQLLSRVQLFATPWTAAHQTSLSITNSQSSLKLMSIESVMPSNHLILCRPLLPPSIFPSIRVFSNESALLTGLPKDICLSPHLGSVNIH